MKTWRFTFKCEYFGAEFESPLSIDADTYHDATILADAYVKEKFPIACEQQLATIKFEGLGIDPKDWGKSKRELQDPCEYCVSGVCGNETIYDEMDRGFMAHVRDGILNIGVATANFHEHSEMRINYCPMCGRKLEEPTC